MTTNRLWSYPTPGEGIKIGHVVRCKNRRKVARRLAKARVLAAQHGLGFRSFVRARAVKHHYWLMSFFVTRDDDLVPF